MAGLNEIEGISCRQPAGAFYVFPNVQQIPLDCDAFADYLMEKAGVAVLSGTSFGQFGNGYLRLSYANSIENIKAALERIKQAVENLGD